MQNTNDEINFQRWLINTGRSLPGIQSQTYLGPQGFQGFQGNQGFQGVAGTNGAQGSVGPQGSGSGESSPDHSLALPAF